MNERSKSVLVVSTDADDRDLYGEWLEEEGFEILNCPGPRAPDYTCVGGKTGACALASGADLVLIDSLASDDVGEGTSASELVTIYTSLGKPVLEVTTLRRDAVPPAAWLRWPTTRDELVAAVRSQI